MEKLASVNKLNLEIILIKIDIKFVEYVKIYNGLNSV